MNKKIIIIFIKIYQLKFIFKLLFLLIKSLPEKLFGLKIIVNSDFQIF